MHSPPLAVFAPSVASTRKRKRRRSQSPLNSESNSSCRAGSPGRVAAPAARGEPTLDGGRDIRTRGHARQKASAEPIYVSSDDDDVPAAVAQLQAQSHKGRRLSNKRPPSPPLSVASVNSTTGSRQRGERLSPAEDGPQSSSSPKPAHHAAKRQRIISPATASPAPRGPARFDAMDVDSDTAAARWSPIERLRDSLPALSSKNASPLRKVTYASVATQTTTCTCDNCVVPISRGGEAADHSVASPVLERVLSSTGSLFDVLNEEVSSHRLLSIYAAKAASQNSLDNNSSKLIQQWNELNYLQLLVIIQVSWRETRKNEKERRHRDHHHNSGSIGSDVAKR